ncbi:uncharacterized protein LOC123302665 [Chrysoperla carnea]|uniref:uncharacterized protein LOC123302665 n=1 Tax=Chrysoperla carnea TaxID=189513 RepID=UPI001D061CF0|nr:uncharacterized protein LOC123302665 [Chrysoperla carnea]
MSERSEKLQRMNSFNKILNTYNICTQNILFLPSLLIWLRSSILQEYVDKCIKNLKLYAYTNVTQYFTKKQTTVPSTKRKEEPTLPPKVLSKRELFERQLSTVPEVPTQKDGSRVFLKALVYLSLVLVYTQICVLIYVLTLSQITWGMAFLLVAALQIIGVGMVLMRPAPLGTNKFVKRKQRNVSKTNKSLAVRKFDLSKTISKVKIL